MRAILIEGPRSEPVPLAEARAWLRYDTTDEDGIVAVLVQAARQAIEMAISGHMISQRWRFVRDAWPRERTFVLPLTPLQSVDTIRVFDLLGAPQLLTREQFHLAKCGVVPRLHLDGPTPQPGIRASGIEIDVTTGYGDRPEDVPGPLRQALRLTVARWFDNRGDMELGRMPADVLALIAPFRQMRLA